MNINEFGQHSLVTWTEDDLRKERQEMEVQYICVGTNQTFTEDELHICPKCEEKSCPTCGAEIQTIEEYNKNMQINQEKIDNLQ